MDLFNDTEVKAPLAARVRPRDLDEYVGQSHLLGQGKPLRICVESGNLHSMILWGPPGVGKTSFARLLADTALAHFETISAVQSGVKEVRIAAEKAKSRREMHGQKTILFVYEVYRVNKSQQDAFLKRCSSASYRMVFRSEEHTS